MTELSIREARALALAAQGFGPRDGATLTRARARKVIERIAPLQIDSVNVLVRAHYMPLFSRMGPYPQTLLDAMAYTHHELFEYWGHMASFMPTKPDYPLMRYRMERKDDPNAFKGFVRWAAANAKLVRAVLKEVRDRGPIAASDLKQPDRKKGLWWDWADEKTALEWHFYTGAVTAATRRNFERVYDLTERVLPKDVLDAPSIPAIEAQRELLLRGARALGVGAARDIADYYRVHIPTGRRLVKELATEGLLDEVRVEGWTDPAYMLPKTRIPALDETQALVSPFDSLIWDRARTERLFGLHYRIEIYVPPPKRVYGYYVLPFLIGDRFVARVDLKSDRKAGALLVQSAFAEPGAPKRTARALAQELKAMAEWLGLNDVRVVQRGDLAKQLAAAVRA